MNICSLCLALYLGLVIQVCLSAVVISEDGQFAGEEDTERIRTNHTEADNIDIATTEPNIHISDREPKAKDISSSEESSSESNSSDHLENKHLKLSKSNEDSSSEENLEKRSLHKRSLDTKQDLLNSIGNQTFIKENNGVDNNNTFIVEASSSSSSNSEQSTSTTESDLGIITSTLMSEVSVDESASESTTLETDSSYMTESEKTEIESIITTDTNESETTTESESEKTTETIPETTLENQSEIGFETGSTTLKTETSKDVSSSSEDTDEKIAPASSSTPSIEITSPTSEKDYEKSFMESAIQRVNKLSDQIRLVLMHYRKKGVVVVPGQSFFPDPMSMQNFQQSFSVGKIDFKNMNVFGLSNFTVEHVNTDVDRMQVYILLHMKRLVILGNYTMRTFFSRAAGPFNVTLLEVDSEGVAEISTASEGHLEATDSVMDMFTQDMKVDFKNLGFMGSMFQGAVSAVGDALFNSIKPQILERVNLVIRTDVNKKLKELSTKFINKIAPVDLAFSEGRKYVRTHGYDPYNIRDHTFIVGGIMHINITEFWVEGLSRFYRAGNLSLSMDAGVIQIGIHVVTEKLKGHCTWSGQTIGIVKSGKTNFTVDHLQVRALVNQSLDIRKKPQLDDLDLELGWVKVTMDSPMALNLMIEGIINAFPRLIRHIIVDTLEQPLKEKVQEILDKINVEEIVDNNLPRLDSFGL